MASSEVSAAACARSASRSTPCLVGGLIIAVVALSSALIGLFLLDFAFFVGGAAVGVGLVFTFFRFFPKLDVSLGGPVVDGHGLVPFWATALVAAIALGLLLMRKKEQQAILIVLTAFVSAIAEATAALQQLHAQAAEVRPRAPEQAEFNLALLAAGVNQLGGGDEHVQAGESMY